MWDARRTKSKQKLCSQCKDSLRKFKNRLGKMFLCDIYSHNPVSSTELEQRRQTCGKLGEAIRKPDHMKARLYQCMDWFGKMLARDISSVIWFRARGNGWADSAKIENRNFASQKSNQVVRTCSDFLWKCKLRLVGEYGIVEPEFGRSWEGHLGRGDLHKWIGNNTRAQL